MSIIKFQENCTIEEMHEAMDLSAYRKEIDEIDKALHQLLIARMQVMERVRPVKGAFLTKGSHIRAERGAEVMLNAYNALKDFYPKEAIFMIYRALISSSEMTERKFSIASSNENSYWLAREFYGPHIEQERYKNLYDLLSALADKGPNLVGVFPFPNFEETNKWWIALLDIPHKVYAISPGYSSSTVHPVLMVGEVVLLPTPNGSNVTLMVIEWEKADFNILSSKFSCKLIDKFQGFGLLEVDGYVSKQMLSGILGVYIIGCYNKQIEY